MSNMLIYDVLHKEKVYQSVVNDLRRLGVKHRLKKNAVKSDNNKMERNACKRKIFKVALSYQALDVVNLSSGGIVHVPVFLCQATAYLEKCGGLSQEGLFRKAGSQVRQKELIARLDNGGVLGDKIHAIDVANCLKSFFRNLPEPLIPYTFHDLFVRCLMLKTRRVEALLLACILLPQHHLNTLAFFMGFLKKVSLHESQNKMSIDNLATVIGPNIMPLQETTMSAVESRLEAHLVIVKILIENAQDIGVLPEHISESITAEVIGSVETELNLSDESSRHRGKKKKHRSGSLTRMFNGLRKMVGKSGSPGEVGQAGHANNQLVPTEIDPLHTPSIKIGKKRKVTEPVTAVVSVKKKREILEAMPERTSTHYNRALFTSPVSSNPNPVREKSPAHKSKVRKYLTHKVYSEMRVFDKVDKPKKLRMSLDRFVSRSKQKVPEVCTGAEQPIKETYSPCIERRWSSASSSSATKKKNNPVESAVASPAMRKSATVVNVRDDYDRVFMDADVNLSDECGDAAAIQNSTKSNRRRASCYRRSLDTALLSKPTSLQEDFSTSYTPKHDKNLRSSVALRRAASVCNELPQNSASNFQPKTLTNEISNEEYVRVPKSEYEAIKNRVSAIESRISQEFSCIANETDETTSSNSASNVQSEYEKTLGEASIESIISADHLAKRLGKELKIRRSSENKIIRSPSARKIGILRRRSQEKITGRRISRTSSWNISQKTSTENQPREVNYYANRIPQTPDSLCSEETNARLDHLQQQLRTLITHTDEHTRGSFSDDDDEVFRTPLGNNKLASSIKVRRASSFHGNELIDSKYMNNRVKELKKTRSHQNVAFNPKEIVNATTTVSSRAAKPKTITWKDAAGYFDSQTRTNAVNCTPVLQTGRPSIAKLRTQNAGMVLAKAKLFDETTGANRSADLTTEEKKTAVTNNEVKRIKNVDTDVQSPRRSALGRKKRCKSPKNNNAKMRIASSPPAPFTKMQLTIVPTQTTTTTTTTMNTERRVNPCRNPHKFNQENLEFSRNNANISHVKIKDDGFDDINKTMKSPMNSQSFSINRRDSNNFNALVGNSSGCKTPHIKRPLGIKTPKSARSLARRPAIDTRRTPLKAVPSLGTPKRQSPRIILKTRHASID